jgi:MFS family permease
MGHFFGRDCDCIKLLPLLGVKKAHRFKKYDIKLHLDKKIYKGVSSYGFVKLLEGISVGLTVPFLNLYLSDRFGIPTSKISLILSGATLLTVVFIFLNPVISKRLGEVRSLIIYQLIGLPCLMIMGFMNDIWVCAMALVCFRAFFYAMMPIQTKLLMEKIPDKIREFTNSPP